MTSVTFIIRLLGYCKICKENSQVDSRMNTHAEGSIIVYLKTVFVLFLQETIKSTIIMLYELRESTFTRTPTSLPIYMHRDSLLTQLTL